MNHVWRFCPYVLVICGAGILSVALGPDDNWDLLYYHLYAPYAYLHGRYPFDIGPAQSQGFLNPVADLLFYGLISSPLNQTPRIVAFIMGAVHGINAALVLAIAQHVLRPRDAARDPEKVSDFSDKIPRKPREIERTILVAVAVLMGISGAGLVSLLGITTNDLINSIFVLGALLGLLRVADPAALRRPWRGFAMAGLLAGVGIGLKYTAAFFVPGLALVALLAALRRRSVGGPIVFAFAATLGLLAVAGHHMLILWEAFGNPFFPFLNHVFQSPFYEPVSLRDARFVAHDVWQLIGYPFYWAVTNIYVVSEQPFRDWRAAIAYVTIVAGVLTFAARRFRAVRSVDRPTETSGLGLVIVFVVVSAICWELWFGIYRYAVALEMLTGVVTVGVLVHLFANTRLRAAAAVAVLALAATTTVYLDWGRGEYAEKYIDIRVPPLPANSVVLIATGEPAAYFIPFADPTIQFLGIENNYLELSQANKLAAEVKRIMRTPGRPRFVLNMGEFDGVALNELLEEFGLKLGTLPCLPIEQNLAEDEGEALSLCPAIPIQD